MEIKEGTIICLPHDILGYKFTYLQETLHDNNPYLLYKITKYKPEDNYKIELELIEHNISCIFNSYKIFKNNASLYSKYKNLSLLHCKSIIIKYFEPVYLEYAKKLFEIYSSDIDIYKDSYQTFEGFQNEYIHNINKKVYLENKNELHNKLENKQKEYFSEKQKELNLTEAQKELDNYFWNTKNIRSYQPHVSKYHFNYNYGINPTILPNIPDNIYKQCLIKPIKQISNFFHSLFNPKSDKEITNLKLLTNEKLISTNP